MRVTEGILFETFITLYDIVMKESADKKAQYEMAPNWAYMAISGQLTFVPTGGDTRHANLKTTMVYTLVAATNRLGVKSPLDSLLKMNPVPNNVSPGMLFRAQWHLM